MRSTGWMSDGRSMNHRSTYPPSHRRRSRLLRLLLVTVALTLAAAASAQAATLTVDQECVEQGTLETGGGLVSGTITGAPAGASVYVSTDRYSGENWAHFGGDYADMDASGNGT